VKKFWTALLLFLIVVIGYALIGFLFPGGGPWYDSLSKPAGTPPNQVFGIVWGILFVLLALSVVRLSLTHRMTTVLTLLFAVNWFLNQLYTYLFFGRHEMLFAAVDATLLAVQTLVLVLVVGRRDRLSAWLLVPMLLWLSYATYLAWGFYSLNN